MRQFSWIFLILLGLLVLFFSAVGKQGLIHLLQLHSEVEMIAEKNEELKQETATIKRDIRDAKDSPLALEKQAREELGLSRPGEIIYLLPQLRKNES